MSTTQPAVNTSEDIYYQHGSVTITNARAVFGQTSYPLSGITSVAAGIVPGSHTGTLVLIGLAVVSGFFAFLSGEAWYMCGTLAVLFAGAAVVVGKSVRDAYAVKIGTAGAEQQAYTSTDRAEIDRIVAALNDAIVKRG